MRYAFLRSYEFLEQRDIRINANRRKIGIRTLNTCRSRPTWRCRCEIGKINKNVISKCGGSDNWSGEESQQIVH